MKKKLLITGGTGFLGRNLAIKLKEEYDVYLTARNNKQNAYAKSVCGCEVLPMDVSNIDSVRDIINQVRPHIIIHAAATKFVDLSEKQPMECIDINVVGSQNVARVAIDKDVEIVIGISTDKAAPPIRNTYGLSKALMERAFCSMNNNGNTKFSCVRYGNVVWSTGSVLPIWKKMWDETKLIKSTGPEMRRFFFSVDEAVNLVCTAINNINDISGKVLSREMKSAKMEDLLNEWTNKKGGNWEKTLGRPGERNDEILIGESELPYTTEINYNGIKHFIISFNEKSLNPTDFSLTSENAIRLSSEEMFEIITNEPKN